MGNSLNIILGIVSFYFAYLSCQAIASKEFRFNISHVACIFVIALINYYAALYFPMFVKGTISILSYYIIFKDLFKLDTKNSFICLVIYFIILIFLELLVSLGVSVMNNPKLLEYSENMDRLKSILGVITAISMFIFLKFKSANIIIEKLKNILERFNIKIILYIEFLFAVSSMIYSFVYVTKMESNIVYNVMYVISINMILVYIIISIYKYFGYKEISTILQNNESNYRALIDEYKMFKHNIVHEFNCIKSVGNKKVNMLIDEYLDEYAPSNMAINDISKLPHGIQASIYNRYILSLVRPKVFVDTTFFSDPVDTLSLKNYVKLIESIGILFDNAIEYVGEYGFDYIYMSLFENDNSYVFKFINDTNSYFNVDEELKIPKKSTKKNHEGVGIYYILKKTNFKFDKKIINGKYITTLEVKKN